MTELKNPHGTATRQDLVFVLSLIILIISPKSAERMSQALIEHLNK